MVYPDNSIVLVWVEPGIIALICRALLLCRPVGNLMTAIIYKI